jgi:uncharacterized RDD family membrane protein YckC
MTIKFKCACGHELNVPDESAGREAFCPGCRKSVPVPGGDDLVAKSPADDREASEFKPGALANLLGDYLPPQSGGEGEAVLHEQRVGEAPPEAPAPAEEPPPTAEAAADKPEQKPEEKAAEKDEDRAAPEAPERVPAAGSTEERPAEPKPPLPPARAAAEQPGSANSAEEKPSGGDPPAGEKPAGEKAEDRVPDDAVKAAPAAEAQDVPPPGVEVFPDKIKFRCKCGQKVAVRIPAPHSAGKCPRCKRTLEVPRVPGVTDKKPRKAKKDRTITSAKDLRHCSKCGRRIEDPRAVFCPRCGFPVELRPPDGKKKETAEIEVEKRDPEPAELRRRSAREAADLAAELLRPPSRMEVTDLPPDLPPPRLLLGQPAGIGRRMGAFLLDALGAVGVAVGGYVLAGRAGLQAALVPSAVAAAGAFLLINEVIFASLAGGRSLGMLVSGITVHNHEGQPAGPLLLLVRLLAWLLLLVFSPIALLDSQRRTLHDMVCGTTVRRSS